MKEIKLTKGKVAIVDDEDFEALNAHKWCASKGGNNFYAVRAISVDGKYKPVLMHNVIMNRKGIDHIDHSGLNNQRSNLRVCTHSQNLMNQQKQENTTSRYKGVSFCKQTGKWESKIAINGNKIRIGRFASEVDAAKAYNNKASELFCEFANLNTI